MRVFVAFGYNDRDKWIPKMVFPILNAFGIEVVTGEDMAGEIITEEVRERIRSSDALIGFLTRRDDLGNNTFSTHQWVRDELAGAWGANRKFIEVRETAINIANGALDGRQYLTYDANDQAMFLVNLVTAVSKWAGGNTLRIRLLPSTFCESIKPLIRQGAVQCQYHFLIGSQESEWRNGSLLSLPAGVVIDVDTKGLPSRRENVLIQVKTQANGVTSYSDYEQLNLLSVTMQ